MRTGGDERGSSREDEMMDGCGMVDVSLIIRVE